MSDEAHKLGLTQSAVSAAIKSLEWGMPLFERWGRRMVPVPKARHCLRYRPLLQLSVKIRDAWRA